MATIRTTNCWSRYYNRQRWGDITSSANNNYALTRSLTRCLDEGLVHLHGNDRVRELPQVLLQYPRHTMDVVWAQVYLGRVVHCNQKKMDQYSHTWHNSWSRSYTCFHMAPIHSLIRKPGIISYCKVILDDDLNTPVNLPILNSILIVLISSVLANILYTLKDSASVKKKSIVFMYTNGASKKQNFKFFFFF